MENVDDKDYILSMNNITKIYPNGFVANKGVNLNVRKGEIHAICGENGAGKSTLMEVLFGEETPDEGEIIYKGNELKVDNPLVALKVGIGMVHQHFMLVPSLSVAENMVLGIEPKDKALFDRKAARKLTQSVSEKFNLPIDPDAIVEDLPVGFKQRLEILKILVRGVDILILDEPTAVLTPQETEELFIELKNLRENGYTIIFISHKLHEVKDLCDSLTILRNGEVTGTAKVSEVSESDISRMMVGRDVSMVINKDKAKPKDVILKVRNLDYTNTHGKRIVDNVSFSVRKGEILGIAGVEGNGQREISEIITGLIGDYSGVVEINGNNVSAMNIKDIRNLGVANISEDRMTYGTVIDASIEENMISDRVEHAPYSNKLGLIDFKFVAKEVDERIVEYKVKADSRKALMRTLSGGNMQKVVVAREFSSNPILIIANQPTRGIDVGASEFIRNTLVQLRDENIAILLISADLTEVLEVSDSIMVMNDGHIAGYFSDHRLVNEEVLGEYMLGIKKQSEKEIMEVCYE